MTQESITTSYNWQGFLLWLASVVALGILGVVALVTLVDPYGLYQVINRQGFNVIKPELSRYVEEIKLTHAVKLKPDVVILGNSRAEIGFDPESPAFSNRAYSAYNLAVKGSSAEISHRQLEYLAHKGITPKIIVFGLEFIPFLSELSSASPPVQPDGSFPADRWFWRFDSLFSMTSVKDAITTLLIQSNEAAATITSRGFNPMKYYVVTARDEGYFALFHHVDKEYARILLKQSTRPSYTTFLDHLRGILEISSHSHGEVVLIIYPYHAQIMAMFEKTGMWSAFENWKMLIQAEISAARKLHPHLHITLADFSGYGAYQCEYIPVKGDRKTSTNRYWDGGHFKKNVGDIVLETALSISSAPPVAATGEPVFGMWLDEFSTDQNRQRIAKERAECANAYPQLFADVENLVSEARTR